MVAPLGGDSDEYIFRPVITLRNGRRLVAAQYGLKAWKIRVRKKSAPPPLAGPKPTGSK